MNNFGVIELATTKTTNAPGWAYVPDRQHPPPSHLASTITNRKRARNAAGAGGAGAVLSHADASARQEAKARREIEILDRDNARDVQIAIPAKPSGSNRAGGGGGGARKYTPNVRRILQSQKTFANHLDDYTALLAHQESANANSNAGVNTVTSGGGGSSSARATPGMTSAHTTGTPSETTSRRSGRGHTATSSTSASKKPGIKQEQPSEDIEMPDALPDDGDNNNNNPHHNHDNDHGYDSHPHPRSTILTPYDRRPPPHSGDTDPLLASRLPPLPTDDELRALLAAPPLSYLEARAAYGGGDGDGNSGPRYPTRVFCAVCGYWGRVRCMKCGTRVCALECLETHREECITRYGL